MVELFSQFLQMLSAALYYVGLCAAVVSLCVAGYFVSRGFISSDERWDGGYHYRFNRALLVSALIMWLGAIAWYTLESSQSAEMLNLLSHKINLFLALSGTIGGIFITRVITRLHKAHQRQQMFIQSNWVAAAVRLIIAVSLTAWLLLLAASVGYQAIIQDLAFFVNTFCVGFITIFALLIVINSDWINFAVFFKNETRTSSVLKEIDPNAGLQERRR